MRLPAQILPLPLRSRRCVPRCRRMPLTAAAIAFAVAVSLAATVIHATAATAIDAAATDGRRSNERVDAATPAMPPAAAPAAAGTPVVAFPATALADGIPVAAVPAAFPPNQAWQVDYSAWNGALRRAIVLLPAGYSAEQGPLPCVIAAHGRDMPATVVAQRWGSLPTDIGCAVVCADSAGVREAYNSWAAPGQLYDLMRLPDLVQTAVPSAVFDDSRLYAVGVSMGAQEVLCLAARSPDRRAGGAAFDGVTALSARYRAVLLSARGGRGVQRRMRHEMGGTPRQAAFAYRVRSPQTYAVTLATAGVPLQLWWSPLDTRVINQATTQTGALYRRICAVCAAPQVVEVRTAAGHGVAFRAGKGLEEMLQRFRPNGEWVARASSPPQHLVYVSGMSQAQFWGYSVQRVRSSPSFWWAEIVSTREIRVSSRVGLWLTIPCPGTGSEVMATVNGHAQVLPVSADACTVKLPAGSSTVMIGPAQEGSR